MDIAMPGQDGIVTTRELLTPPLHAQVSLVTSYDKAERQHAAVTGARLCIERKLDGTALLVTEQARKRNPYSKGELKLWHDIKERSLIQQLACG